MGAYSNLGDFSTAQAISQAVESEYYLDMVDVKSQMNVGSHAPFLCIRTAVAPTVTTDTLSIELQCHEDASFGAGTPATTFDYTKVWTILGGPAGAELHADVDLRLTVAGAWIYRGQMPYECDERYVRLYYNQTATDGVFTIDAWLSDGPPSDFRGSQKINSNVGNP